MAPTLSNYFQSLQTGPIREAQLEFARRSDPPTAIDLSVGSIRLPMHPAMRRRLHGLDAPGSPFRDGTVPYTATAGLHSAREAMRHILAASGLPVDALSIQITQGASQAIELAILATCGDAGSNHAPLLLIDPSYANYRTLASKLGRAVVSVRRDLRSDGRFHLPSLEALERRVQAYRPGALLITPYDNPTGQVLDRATLRAVARICVRQDIWLLSDETYRELHYGNREAASIWSIAESEVPGITGRRVTIESASKVWNACGLRVGALVTDNAKLHEIALAESSSSLCASTLGQFIFAALAREPAEALHQWYREQRLHYGSQLTRLAQALKAELPGAIVSRADGAIYSVIDLVNIVPRNFDARAFSRYCARYGDVEIEGQRYTLLVAPMGGFYGPEDQRIARTQIRLALVEAQEALPLVPSLLRTLLERYVATIDPSLWRGSVHRRGGPTP